MYYLYNRLLILCLYIYLLSSIKQNNSMLEAANSVIQRIKKVACVFRNKQRFSTSVMFRLGKLDMLLAT